MKSKTHKGFVTNTLLSRQHTLRIRINDCELKAIEAYCGKYKIDNKSRWIRETLMNEVIRSLEQDVPMLFTEEEMK
ncbi:hypothetical protein [Porphyromonas pogonae]|uniref:hypothetical protein n=1 Tax=Porphyromonas pogonae TaxID=867595 RepID=UPI002E7A5FDC|nr:hypothetical protein [Porphyromonas pogonae]